jgi:chromosome segregation ATPase
LFHSISHVSSDLEAAARAKTKLSSNNASQAKEDSQTITSLHNQLVELEGISAYLPALTSRLSDLSNLHSNAAEFGSRLDAAEETLTRSEALLANVEEALTKLERGWKENMEAVERNVKKLDELVARK